VSNNICPWQAFSVNSLFVYFAFAENTNASRTEPENYHWLILKKAGYNSLGKKRTQNNEKRSVITSKCTHTRKNCYVAEFYCKVLKNVASASWHTAINFSPCHRKLAHESVQQNTTSGCRSRTTFHFS